MSVFKRWNGTSWEVIGPQITSTRFDDTNHMIAPEYSSTDIYNVGDYVVQSDKLYKCISAIESAEEWTAAHWSQVSIGEEISDLNSGLADSNLIIDSSLSLTWEQGSLNNLGEERTSENAIRSVGYTVIPSSNVNVTLSFGTYTSLLFRIYIYNESDVFQNYNTYNVGYVHLIGLTPGYKIRFRVGPSSQSTDVVSPTDGDVLVQAKYNKVQNVKPDKTLSISDRLADSKTVGDKIEKAVQIVGDAQYVGGWSQGKVDPINGGSSSSNYHCRTSTFEFEKSGTYLVTPKQGFVILLNEYNGTPSAQTFIEPLINESSQAKKVEINSSYKFRWCVSKTDGSELALANLPSDVVSYQLIETISDRIKELDARIDDTEEDITAVESDLTAVESNLTSITGIPPMLIPISAYPCYDHLFVNNNGNKSVIPHESIYHVNISRSLGYRVIEANVQITSDGHYFVNHLANGGTFGSFFYAVDDSDISNVKASEVTWQWIVDNVRYMSTVPKYRTRPTTLEEFLIGCKQNQLIPLLKFLDNNIKEMTERIMGKNNYIVYAGTREMAGDAVIFRWESYTTLEDILAFCDSIGKPLIYGTSKFNTDFTKEESAEIIDELHKRGYMVCMSYEANEFWRQYRPLGIDFCGGTRTTNRLVTGNAYNLENIFNTNDFTVSNGTITDNVITLAENGTVRCTNIDLANRQVAHVDLEVDFDGILTLTGGLGEFRGDIDFDSIDGKLIVCTAVINKPINFMLTAKGGSVTIRDIKYKVSIC